MCLSYKICPWYNLNYLIRNLITFIYHISHLWNYCVFKTFLVKASHFINYSLIFYLFDLRKRFWPEKSLNKIQRFDKIWTFDLLWYFLERSWNNASAYCFLFLFLSNNHILLLKHVPKCFKKIKVIVLVQGHIKFFWIYCYARAELTNAIFND